MHEQELIHAMQAHKKGSGPPLSQDKKNEYFVSAAEMGKTPVMTYFLEIGADIHGEFGSALAGAIRNNYPGTVEKLLWYDQYTPEQLIQAFRSSTFQNKPAVMEVLLTKLTQFNLHHKISTDTFQQEKNTLLISSVCSNHIEATKLLVQNNANVHVEHDGGPLIFFALTHHQLEIAHALMNIKSLDYRPTVSGVLTQKNDYPLSQYQGILHLILHQIMQIGMITPPYEKLIILLFNRINTSHTIVLSVSLNQENMGIDLSACASLTQTCKDQLLQILLSQPDCSHHMVRQLCNPPIAANIRANNDASIIAAAERNPQELGFLIDNGANVNAQDGEPLIRAAQSGAHSACRLLLDQGARVSAQDNSAIVRSAHHKQANTMVILLNHGADPCAQECLPLYTGIEKNNTLIVEVLLKTGAYSQSQLNQALAFALGYRKKTDSLCSKIAEKKILSLLFKAGAQLNQTLISHLNSKTIITLFSIAAISPQPHNIVLLINSHITITPEQKDKGLLIAVQNGCTTTVITLIQEGANPLHQDGYALLLAASSKSNIQTLRALLAATQHPQIRLNQALIEAVSNNTPYMALELLQAGAEAHFSELHTNTANFPLIKALRRLARSRHHQDQEREKTIACIAFILCAFTGPERTPEYLQANIANYNKQKSQLIRILGIIQQFQQPFAIMNTSPCGLYFDADEIQIMQNYALINAQLSLNHLELPGELWNLIFSFLTPSKPGYHRYSATDFAIYCNHTDRSEPNLAISPLSYFLEHLDIANSPQNIMVKMVRLGQDLKETLIQGLRQYFADHGATEISAQAIKAFLINDAHPIVQLYRTLYRITQCIANHRRFTLNVRAMQLALTPIQISLQTKMNRSGNEQSLLGCVQFSLACLESLALLPMEDGKIVCTL